LNNRHTEQSFCEVELSIKTVININFSTIIDPSTYLAGKDDSVLFVPHKPALPMTTLSLRLFLCVFFA